MNLSSVAPSFTLSPSDGERVKDGAQCCCPELPLSNLPRRAPNFLPLPVGRGEGRGERRPAETQQRTPIGTLNRPCIIAMALLLLAGGSCLNASAAAWGSLRANNRSPHEEEHGGPRAFQPPPAREHGGSEAIRERERESEVARNRGHEWDAGRRVEIEREARERRHLDIDEDRRHSYFWYGYHPGMIIGALPPGFVPIEVGGNPYFYDQGVYYESTPSGYVVVNPPIGASVSALPPGAEALAVGSMIYYYAAGAFYLPQPQGYLVVQPPLGITVTALPPGAVPVIINGVQYYQADGAYFLPVMQGGVTAYTTVQP